MKCSPSRLGFALAITLSVAFTICAIISTFSMDLATQASRYMMYAHPEMNFTIATYLYGLVQVFIYSWLVGWFFALVYNGLGGGSCDTKKCK